MPDNKETTDDKVVDYREAWITEMRVSGVVAADFHAILNRAEAAERKYEELLGDLGTLNEDVRVLFMEMVKAGCHPTTATGIPGA